MALIIERYLTADVSTDDDEVARDALAAAVTEEETRCGSIWLTPEQAGMIVDRCAAVLYHFRTWWPTTGLTIIGCELEIRSHHTVERGGRIDFLARDRDGRIGILDGKAFGMFGKSVNSQNIKPDLDKENQCGWYGAILESGCLAFTGVPNRCRHTLTSGLKEEYPFQEFATKVDFYGQILYGHLLEFTRNGKHAVKGDKRGQCLFTTPFHPYLVRNADDLAAWYHVVRTLAPAPAVRRYEGLGKYNCDSCKHKIVCWPGADSPEPVRDIPDFVKELMT